MIDRLERCVGDVSALHSKLIVVVGGTGASRSTRLAEFGRHHDARVLSPGQELGHRLAACPVKQRSLMAPVLLRELADQYAAKGLLLLRQEFGRPFRCESGSRDRGEMKQR